MPETRTLCNAANRRRSRRSPLSGQTRVECRKGALGLGRNLAVRALDLSETGIRLVLRDLLAPGDGVEVILSGPGVRGQLKRLGRVVWCLPLSAADACAGVAFEKPLPWAEAQRLQRPEHARRE